jgi:competence protein CoiA
MKYALIGNTKIEATKGAKGTCPVCGSELIAKCGPDRMNHWAHKGTRNCDPWWENETEWHRTWKSNFPPEWQEVIHTDTQTGEKHIADVCTSNGFIIEFQHSFLNTDERISREQFYKNLVWVIDGTRLKKDYPRFLKAKEKFRLTSKRGWFIVDFPDQCFPSSWVSSSVPVIFDFKGVEKINYAHDWRYPLYLLFPKTDSVETYVVIISRQIFINSVITGDFFKQEQEPQQQKIMTQQINSVPTESQRPSQYVFNRGRYEKRRRL